MSLARSSMARIVLAAMLCALAGCEKVAYIAHVAVGQLGVQGGVEPIEDVLASGRLSADQEAKLRLLLEVRQFAIEKIGLNAGDSYTTFYDTNGDPLSFNLSAATRDALVPFVWEFPLVGTIPYLGFFDREYAESVQQGLEDLGYDTVLYEVDAYSTLGLFADPVRSPMLERDEVTLVDTLIHELLHNTVWRNDDTEFNESLATFVGRTGGLQFLKYKFGESSELVISAANYYVDLDRINDFLMALFLDLEGYYALPISSDDKVVGREGVYQAGRDRFVTDVLPQLSVPDHYAGLASLPTNNAWMLGNYRYNLDLDLFGAVYEAQGESWPESLEVFQQATGAEDPKEFLREWLRVRGIDPPAKPRSARRVRVSQPVIDYPFLTLPTEANRLAADQEDDAFAPTLLRADDSCRVKRREPMMATERP